ncbi:MAG: hypothetical protein D6719_02755 [Candidatus Dadabacteria bacterium]|nr:MAG: hypothetical protein D6719_02755 [Candidatus Dadabacteria bacterium]
MNAKQFEVSKLLILRPKILSIRNQLRLNRSSLSTTIRDAVILLFALTVVLAIFRGTLAALAKLESFKQLAYLPPSQPIALVLMLLFFSLVITGFATALGTLFLAKDLELLHSSPISMRNFFIGKLIYITLQSSWMPLIFLLPFLAAFGWAYNVSFLFYITAVALLVPFFLIASSLGIIIAIALTATVPANRTRSLLWLVIVLGLYGLYYVVELVSSAGGGGTGVIDVIRSIAVLSAPQAIWLPSNWVAAIIGAILEPRLADDSAIRLTALISTTFLLCSLAYLLFDGLYLKACSLTRNTLGKNASSGTTLLVLPAKLFSLKSRAFSAIFLKDYRNIMRDLAQSSQLLILIGICLIYVYNLRIFHTVESLPEGIRETWQEFLGIANIGIGAFIATAMCTRFVFPSISLEGRSIWILQTAPIKTTDILWAKFYNWIFSVSLVAVIIFSCGALITGLSLEIATLHTATAVIICYGLVGLAVGYGAYFANFNWEHPSELAASFGSLCYMLSAIILILLSILPGAFAIYLAGRLPAALGLTRITWLAGISCGLFLLFMINRMVARTALTTGARKLNERQT